MAQNVTVAGASYEDVPSVSLPKTGGGMASFTDVSDTTATDADVVSGAYFYSAGGVRTAGAAVIPSPSDATPQALGTAAAGSSSDYSRADHVHAKPSASDVGAIAAPSTASSDNVLAYNGTTWVADKRTVILSYGSSTWAQFISAYNANAVVYCRASSNSNPATGSQTRMAFMAYVSDATNPTSVEFQYYRSVSSHSATQQGDQVYVYKLTSAGAWTVTVRENYTKIVAGTGLSSSYSSGTLTLSSSISVPTASDATPQPTGTASAGSSSDYSRADHVHAKPTYTASDVGALPANTEIHNIPSGGSAGQVLTKNSGTNYDASWITPSGGGDILLCEVDSVQYTSSMTSSEIDDAISDGKQVMLVWKDYDGHAIPGGFLYYLGGDAYGSVTYLHSDEINYIDIYIDSNGYPSWNTYFYPMLPSVSSSDEGKVLRVVNGVWAAEELPSASGVSF